MLTRANYWVIPTTTTKGVTTPCKDGMHKYPTFILGRKGKGVGT